MEELLRKESVKDKKRCTAKQDRIYFLGMLGFAVVVYFPLISQRLVNTYDGLWHGAYYMGGFWELSIGRWLLPAVDFLRFGIQTEPINALLTLSMIALAVAMLRRLFAVNDKPLTWLAGMGFVSGAVVGVWLSYRYTSPIFGLSFLLSAAAADHATRTEHIGKAIGESAVLLALSLGLYQANLACSCMILLAYLLRLLFRAEGKKQVHAHIAKSLGSAASGMILYWLVLKLVLLACGQQLASYNGAAEISVKSILLGLPGGILQAYQLFATYFFQNIYRHNTLQTFGLFIVVLAVIGVGFLRRFAQIVRRKDLEGALLCMAAMLVLPLSCNMMMLISSEAAWRMQMGAGLALFVPLCLLLLADDRPEQEHDSKVRWLVLVLAVLIVYGNVYMMATDQEAMRQGRDLEDYVAQRFTEATGLKVRRANAIYQSEEHPLLLADFDRLIVGQKAGLECKTVSPFSADKWADGKIPAHYMAQVNHYLAVSGFDCWYIAALIFGEELVIHKITTDKEVLNNLIAKEEHFWKYNVMPEIPPVPTGSEGDTQQINQLYSADDRNKTADLNPIRNLLDKRQELSDQIEQMEQEKTAIEQQVKLKMQDAAYGTAPGYKVSWVSSESKRVDSQRLKKEQPDIFNRYSKNVSSRRFTIIHAA